MSNHISQAIEQLEYAENTNCINNPTETKTELLRSQAHALIAIAQQLRLANGIAFDASDSPISVETAELLRVENKCD
jgi:hypothetical protein